MSNSSNASDPCSVATTTQTASSAQALQAVGVLYSFLFVVTLAIYCLIRNKYKTLYNCRNSVERLNCELAKQEYKPFRWIDGVLKVSEDEIFEQCGFDAVAYIRLLKLGTKLALLGCFIAIWLCPTYRSAPTTSDNEHVTDSLDAISVGRVNSNDDRMFGSVMASWMINVFAMYLLYVEFEWFIAERHKYMSRRSPENYTVFIGGIPNKLRSVTAMERFLRVLFKDELLEVQLTRNIGRLEKLVHEEEKLTAKLMHDQSFLEKRGSRLHSFTPHGGVDAIAFHSAKLDHAKAKVTIEISALEKEWEDHERSVEEGEESALEHPPATIRDAAFVSFTTLQAATTAVQVLHHRKPFSLLAQAAPRPDEVKWSNVGFTHWKLQLSSILAGAMTGVLILLWTFPMVFVASLTKVAELKKRVPFLEQTSDNMVLGDWRVFDDLLAAVAPVALLTLNGWLPTILGWFCLLEGHIGEETRQASIYSKLTLFQLVQTFFVSAVAGSIMDQINCLVDDPAGQTMKILAKSLPAQAVTFMGLTIVQTTFGMAVELLRPFPALYAAIRKCIGPNLTEEEREQDFLSFSPLCNPGGLDFTSLCSDLILMFITLFVYSILSPIACFISLLGFVCLHVGYRNQLIHVYDPSNDTGGALFPKVATYLVVCMLIAQVTVLGVVSLNEGSRMVPLMLPLLILTILFWRYLQQQHLRVASTLPVMECHNIDEDAKTHPDGLAFLLGAYRQQALTASRAPDKTEDTDDSGRSSGRVFSNQASATLGIASAKVTLGLASATIGTISSPTISDPPISDLPEPVDRSAVGWSDSFSSSTAGSTDNLKAQTAALAGCASEPCPRRGVKDVSRGQRLVVAHTPAFILGTDHAPTRRSQWQTSGMELNPLRRRHDDDRDVLRSPGRWEHVLFSRTPSGGDVPSRPERKGPVWAVGRTRSGPRTHETPEARTTAAKLC